MRAAIVIGVSRGLGRGLAEALLARGFVVLGLGRGAGTLEKRERFRFAACDLAEADAIAAAVGPAMRALSREGPESVAMICSAAVAEPVARIGALDAHAAFAALAVNLLAPIVLSDLFLRTFTDEATDRRIIHISSGSAQRALAGSGLYSIAKAGIEMLTQSIAADCTSPSFRCIALRPGIFETAMQVKMRGLDPAEFPSVTMFRGFKEQGLLKDPAEVAVRIVERLVLAPVEHGRVYPHTELWT